MSESETQSGADLLARIRPQKREESTQLILRPDLVDEWQKADDQLTNQRMADAANKRLASGVSQTTRDLAKKVQKLEREIEKFAITFRFRAMSKDEYRALCDSHPPRQGDQVDQFTGYNRDAVLDAMVRACLYDPVFDDAAWAEFVSVCNPSEWDELRDTVNSVNRGVVDAPKSVLASRILTKRGSASGRHAPSE
jgi:hypothetical protein